jgi:hypothetical protein
MCSTWEERFAELRGAIDEVALAAHADLGGHADLEELTARLAGLWAMIAELDPGLAARLRGYCPDTSLGTCLAPPAAPGPGTAWVAGSESGHGARHRQMTSGGTQPTATGTVGSGGSGSRENTAGYGDVGPKAEEHGQPPRATAQTPAALTSRRHLRPVGLTSRRSRLRSWRSPRGAAAPGPGAPRSS